METKLTFTFYQKLYAIAHISKMKYSGKSLLATVTELFAADLGSLWGLGCCPAVLRLELLTGPSSASATGSVGSIGNSAAWGSAGISLGPGMSSWGCSGSGSTGTAGSEGSGGPAAVSVGFCSGISSGSGTTVSDINSWDTSCQHLLFPPRAFPAPLNVVYRSSVTKSFTPTLRGKEEAEVSQQLCLGL